MNDSSIESAASAAFLLKRSAQNIVSMLNRSDSPVVERSIAELVEGRQWEELNHRFFKPIAFATGGLRGRTIGKIITRRTTTATKFVSTTARRSSSRTRAASLRG